MPGEHKPRCVVSFEGGSLEDSDSRFVSCTIDDHAGYQNDSAEIVLCNHPYAEYPAPRTEFTVKLGYGDNLVTMGKYVIDELEDTGPPDILTVRGHGIDTDSAWKEIRFYEYNPGDFPTIGDIAKFVIERNGGKPVIDPYFYEIQNPYVPQRNQSDQDFLTKLGEFYGGILKPLMGHIYFIRKGQDSEDAPTFEVARSQVEHHSYLLQGRSSFGIVVGRWRDVNTGKDYAISMQTGLDSQAVFVMPKIYNTAQAAKGAAFAQAESFQKSKETFNFSMYGVPGLVAESKIKTKGFHPSMPAEWRVLQCSHTLHKQEGYKTNAVCEIPKNPPRGVDEPKPEPEPPASS